MSRKRLVNPSLEFYRSDLTQQTFINWQYRPIFGHFQPSLKNAQDLLVPAKSRTGLVQLILGQSSNYISTQWKEKKNPLPYPAG